MNIRKTLKIRTPHSLTLASLGVLLGGCMAEIESEETDAEDMSQHETEPADGTDPENTFFTRTSVTLSPDGNHRTSTKQISLAQQIAERKAEEAGLPLTELYEAQFPDQLAVPTEDNCMYLASLRMWSGTNYTGNQLCLTGTGYTSLHNFTECGPMACCRWGAFDLPFPVCNIPVKSFKTGTKNVLYQGLEAYQCVEYAAGVSQAVAGGAVEAAHYVGRDEHCPPE